jgi:hypothetical protein
MVTLHGFAAPGKLRKRPPVTISGWLATAVLPPALAEHNMDI